MTGARPRLVPGARGLPHALEDYLRRRTNIARWISPGELGAEEEIWNTCDKKQVLFTQPSQQWSMRLPPTKPKSARTYGFNSMRKGRAELVTAEPAKPSIFGGKPAG